MLSTPLLGWTPSIGATGKLPPFISHDLTNLPRLFGSVTALPNLWTTAPAAMPSATPATSYGSDEQHVGSICRDYVAGGYGTLRLERLDSGSTMATDIRKARPPGMSRGDSRSADLIAHWLAKPMFQTYMALYRIGRNAFWAEEHMLYRSALDEQTVLDMPHSVSIGRCTGWAEASADTPCFAGLAWWSHDRTRLDLPGWIGRFWPSKRRDTQ